MLSALLKLVPVALFLATMPAFAAPVPADPQSRIGRAGAAILAEVAGRDGTAAYAQSHDAANPFSIDTFALAGLLGLSAVNVDASQLAGNGQLSILMRFNTPEARFIDGAETPGIIPFAFMLENACFGGYVAGYPVPDTVFAMDMADTPCSATGVELAVGDYYRTFAREAHDPIDSQLAIAADARAGFDPAAATDFQLEMALYAAYNGARLFAIEHDNYFLPPGSAFADLRARVIEGLHSEGYDAAAVAMAEAESFNALLACAAEDKVEIRLRARAAGGGLTLAIVSDTRLALYDYDPDVQADVVITQPRDCVRAGMDTAPASG